MVRVFLKGGVWKNSEDEILKAAVMKYGKQQWARVASLLNRKSAKQCKARWHEWLDPSVRKVEWSRPEEEKLLHLAKLMPAQWKTIAPLVGRTAAQCQEHYEALLDDAATGKDDQESLRQSSTLQPGQIDSHPETKPARPDPIDMDEDEIEMLQEARARLANTQGKKAKRKQREKMLAEAKRLADLQKRRELKQAGLLSSAAAKKAKKKNRDIDLGVEIPFHKPAPAGFHDVSNEDARAEQIRTKRLHSVDFQKLNETQYRSRDRAAAQAKKREDARLRSLERSNMQYAVAQVSKKNDPLATRKRRVLELPAPTVTDQELGHLSKLQAAAAASLPEEAMGGTGATQALLGDYSQRPLPTPMRTPLSSSASSQQQQSTQESILRTASNLRRLEQGQTPLLGGEGPVLEEAPDVMMKEGDNVSAATPRRTAAATATPLVSATPRDELGLNVNSQKRPFSEMREGNDDMSVGASTFSSTTLSIRELARQERRAAKKARQDLEAALAALPAPQFEYELAAPQDVVDDDDDEPKVETVSEMDAADVEAAERARLAKEADRLYEARSSVVKRTDLPRPVGSIPSNAIELSETPAERLIQEEMLTLLKHDAHAFPVLATGDGDAASSGKKKKKRKKTETTLPPETPLDYIPEDALDEAKQAILGEFETLYNERLVKAMTEGNLASVVESASVLLAANQKSSTQGADGLAYTEADGWRPTKSSSKVVDSLKLEYNALKEAAASMRKRNDKLESKLSVKHGGYLKRAESIRDSALQSFAQLRNAEIEGVVFANLETHEVRGGTSRTEKLREEIEQLEESEMAAQKRYGDLQLEKRRLQVKLK